MRVGSMYASPFRLLHRARPEPDYGEVLTPAVALSADGPLAGSSRRRHAVDGRAVADRYRELPLRLPVRRHPRRSVLPTFWAARVPNHVMPEESYEVVLDMSRPLDERRAAFFDRAQFFRNIDRPRRRTPSSRWSTTGTGSASSPSSRDRTTRPSRLLQGRDRQRIPA